MYKLGKADFDDIAYEFLDEYLPIVLFKITYKNDYIHLTPLNNINSNNKLLSENKVYICI